MELRDEVYNHAFENEELADIIFLFGHYFNEGISVAFQFD